MYNIRLTVAYDGRRFLGWQKTRMGPSVQESIEVILEQMLQEKVELQAASRTDAGVHAHGQVVNFLTNRQVDPSRFLKSLNKMLPRDIAILTLDLVPDHFHPTLDCVEKEYRYFISNALVQPPEKRFYSWHCPEILDKKAMIQAASHLIGTHDFSAFCNVKKNEVYESHVREVTKITMIEQDPHHFYFKICGKSFLYKMVRNIVGTLVYVGKGKLDQEQIPFLLQNRDRKLIGITAPAHALSLYHLKY